MPVVVPIDVMMARRKMSVGELADRVSITPTNLAVLKNGRREGRAVHDARRAVRRARMPAGRPVALGGPMGARAAQTDITATALQRPSAMQPSAVDRDRHRPHHRVAPGRYQLE